jgi:hypothetical protein
VAAVLDQLEPGAVDRGQDLVGAGGEDHPVAVAPDDEHGADDPVEPERLLDLWAKAAGRSGHADHVPAAFDVAGEGADHRGIHAAGVGEGQHPVYAADGLTHRELGQRHGGAHDHPDEWGALDDCDPAGHVEPRGRHRDDPGDRQRRVLGAAQGGEPSERVPGDDHVAFLTTL